jgi:hypothetical protein
LDNVYAGPPNATEARQHGSAMQPIPEFTEAIGSHQVFERWRGAIATIAHAWFGSTKTPHAARHRGDQDVVGRDVEKSYQANAEVVHTGGRFARYHGSLNQFVVVRRHALRDEAGATISGRLRL